MAAEGLPDLEVDEEGEGEGLVERDKKEDSVRFHCRLCCSVRWLWCQHGYSVPMDKPMMSLICRCIYKFLFCVDERNYSKVVCVQVMMMMEKEEEEEEGGGLEEEAEVAGLEEVVRLWHMVG